MEQKLDPIKLAEELREKHSKKLAERLVSLGETGKKDGNNKQQPENAIENFSEYEIKLLKIYDEDAGEMVEFIKKINYEGDYGFGKQDAEKIIAAQMERMWGIFVKDMIDEGKFSSQEKEAEAFQIIKIKWETGEKKQESAKMEEITEEKDHPSRAASWHTIYKLENSPDLKYEDVNAPSVGEGDKKFKELTKKLWNELTVHGFAEKDLKTGDVKIKRESDQDGRGFLKLLEMAGIEVDQNKINYVNKGETAESGIIGDTSNVNGVVAKERGKKLIIDHHGEGSDRSTSTTKNTYELLVGLGLLKREKYLDKFVEFVTKCDNEDFTDAEDRIIFENYSRNLYGLRDKLKIEEVLELFEKGVDPAKNLPVDYLKNHKYEKGKIEMTLFDFSGELKSNKDKAEKMIDKLEKEGFVLDTGKDRFGKILIDTKVKKPDGRWFAKVPQVAYVGRLAARIKGFGGYIIWSDSEKSFVLYTKKRMDESSIPGGFPDPENALNIRGHMLVKNATSTKPLKIKLEDILGKLSGKSDFKIEGKLKDVLDKEDKERAKVQQKIAVPTPPSKPPDPENPPMGNDEKQEKISEAVKKMADLFSNYELTYNVIEEEAKHIQVNVKDLAVGFIESNDELKPQYDAKKDSINKKDDNAVEKLAVSVILEDEKKKVEEKIKVEGESDILRIRLRKIKADILKNKIMKQNRFVKELQTKYPDVMANFEKQMDEQKVPEQAQLNLFKILEGAKLSEGTELSDRMMNRLASAKIFFQRKQQSDFPDEIDTIRENASGELEFCFGRDKSNKASDDDLVGHLRRTLISM